MRWVRESGNFEVWPITDLRSNQSHIVLICRSSTGLTSFTFPSGCVAFCMRPTFGSGSSVPSASSPWRRWSASTSPTRRRARAMSQRALSCHQGYIQKSKHTLGKKIQYFLLPFSHINVGFRLSVLWLSDHQTSRLSLATMCISIFQGKQWHNSTKYPSH